MAKPLGLLLIFKSNGQTVYSKLSVDRVTLSEWMQVLELAGQEGLGNMWDLYAWTVIIILK